MRVIVKRKCNTILMIFFLENILKLQLKKSGFLNNLFNFRRKLAFKITKKCQQLKLADSSSVFSFFQYTQHSLNYLKYIYWDIFMILVTN